MYNFCLDFLAFDKSLLRFIKVAECPRAWMLFLLFQTQQNHIVRLDGQFYDC